MAILMANEKEDIENKEVDIVVVGIEDIEEEGNNLVEIEL